MQARFAVLGVVSLLSTAQARPVITIHGELPFDERTLGDAVELRIGDGHGPVTVGRDDRGQLIVEAGGRSQTVVLVTSDSQAAARVVAMVVVELVSEPPLERESPLTVARPVSAPDSRFAVRLVPALLRDDSSYTTSMVTGSLRLELSSVLGLVGTIGIGTAVLNNRRDLVFPVRLGLEAMAGSAVGVELGAMTLPYRTTCGDTGSSSGVYGAVRLRVPVGARARAIIEAGGDLMLANNGIASCAGPTWYHAYGGWLGAGVEWSL
ncbi:MAG: hypothetical protein WKG01_28700 [Kofleriaceae bacterium]